MKTTERQTEILNTVVQEYIKSTQPVSSQLLERKYDFGISPASIRIEMQKLTDGGFLCQPHTSAGRIPTDKGYRFFVDRSIKENFLDLNKDFETGDWLEKNIEDTFKFVQLLTKNLALSCSALALSYLFEKDFLWKEGWEEVLQEPEFQKPDYTLKFTKLLKKFEENIENLEMNSEIKIYIGRENPFSKAKDFSTIISKCYFPKKQKGVLAIFGPKRMAYQKNINLVNSITKLLEEY